MNEQITTKRLFVFPLFASYEQKCLQYSGEKKYKCVFTSCNISRSSPVVKASNCQWQSRNCPAFKPSILRHIGIWGSADETVLNTVHKKIRLTNTEQKSVLVLPLFASYEQKYLFIANAEVATVLGSIPASSGTVESEGRQIKHCWIKNIKKQKWMNKYYTTKSACSSFVCK